MGVPFFDKILFYFADSGLAIVVFGRAMAASVTSLTSSRTFVSWSFVLLFAFFDGFLGRFLIS